MKVSPARKAAFEILNRIDSTRAFSSVLLPEYEEKLSSNDRGLCHELVLGVLRRQLYLDRIIDHFTGAKRLDGAVRNALRLGPAPCSSRPANSRISNARNAAPRRPVANNAICVQSWLR